MNIARFFICLACLVTGIFASLGGKLQDSGIKAMSTEAAAAAVAQVPEGISLERYNMVKTFATRLAPPVDNRASSFTLYGMPKGITMLLVRLTGRSIKVKSTRMPH